MFIGFAAFLLPLVIHAFPQDAGVPADARATIAAANADWLPALRIGDATRIAAPYAVDGVFVTATGSMVTGRDAIAQLMRDRIAQMGKVVSGDLKQDGLTRQGTMIYEWGHAYLQVAREGAPSARSSGRYLTVWQRGATGRWEIIRNLSLPE